MSDEDREIGRVESVRVGKEDRGLFSLCIMLDFGGTAQGYGPFVLDTWDAEKDRRVGTAFGCDALSRMLSFFNVDTFDKAKGQAVYAVRKDGPFGLIVALERLECDGGAIFSVRDIAEEWRL